jgi:hypothetical protein
VLEFTRGGALRHYWLANERSITYTNLDVFDELEQVESLDEALSKGERFCLMVFAGVPLNTENTERVLSSGRLLKTERVVDRKSGNGVVLVLYILEYQGGAA